MNALAKDGFAKASEPKLHRCADCAGFSLGPESASSFGQKAGRRGIFSSLAGGPEANEPAARALLAPYELEAVNYTSRDLDSSKNWRGKPATPYARNLFPVLDVHTPFFRIVSALVDAREQRENLSLATIDEVSRTLGFSMSFRSKASYDLKNWEILVDPDRQRALGGELVERSIAQIGDTFFYFSTWEFPATILDGASRPLTAILLRGDLDCIRYTFPSTAR